MKTREHVARVGNIPYAVLTVSENMPEDMLKEVVDNLMVIEKAWDFVKRACVSVDHIQVVRHLENDDGRSKHDCRCNHKPIKTYEDSEKEDPNFPGNTLLA